MKKIFILACIFIMLATTFSYADIYDYKWNTDLKVYVENGSEYELETGLAVDDWDDVLSDIGSSIDVNNSYYESNANVIVQNDDWGDTPWAARCLTYHPDNIATYASIQCNDYLMDSYSSPKQRAALCHELGHALGLAHTTGSTSIDSIMWISLSTYYGQQNNTTPQTYDKMQLDLIY